MLEVWDWYVDRFRDRAVLLTVKDRIFVHVGRGYSGGLLIREEGIKEMPYYPGDIAKQINRSERSVEKSLERLYSHDKIERFLGGWRLKT